jgi:hypothetical protein
MQGLQSRALILNRDCNHQMPNKAPHKETTR